jgi:hypothetical protein
MTAAKALEYHIIQQQLHRTRQHNVAPLGARWADRLIGVLATTVGLFLVGSFMEELLWVVLAGATMFILGYEN